MKKVAIGGGQGFWGDSPDAAIHMIRNADISVPKIFTRSRPLWTV